MIAIYPGSFNPWHEGHRDLVIKARYIFTQVIVAQGYNTEKQLSVIKPDQIAEIEGTFTNVKFMTFSGTLPDFVQQMKANAVIRGIRNAQDFEAEKIQQYWYEDLGLSVPVLYI